MPEAEILWEQAEQIVRKIFPESKLEDLKKNVEGGLVNPLFELDTSNPSHELILRFCPPRYEHYKMEKEEFVYGLIAQKTDVPVPHVFLIDKTRSIVPFAFMVMPKMRGKVMPYVKELMSRSEKLGLYDELGETLAKIHAIRFDKWGWINGRGELEGCGTPGGCSSWPEFFRYDLELKLANLEGKISGADKLANDCRQYVKDHETLLDVSDSPCLVHNDYHWWNILVDRTRAEAKPKWHVSSVFDVEWAISGHSEVDLTRTERHILRYDEDFPEALETFFQGYRRRGKISVDYEQRKFLYMLERYVTLIPVFHDSGDKKRYDHVSGQARKIVAGKEL